MFKWITESNRIYHVWIGYFSALIGTIIGAIEVACSLESKDCQYDRDNNGLPPWKWDFKKWDWLDWTSTVLGGILGQITQIIIIWLIFFL